MTSMNTLVDTMFIPWESLPPLKEWFSNLLDEEPSLFKKNGGFYKTNLYKKNGGWPVKVSVYIYI